MTSRLSFDSDLNQVIIEGNHHVRKIILNRPKQLNCLSDEMVMQLLKALEKYEVDDTVKLLILTGQGRAFCSGGDIVRSYQQLSAGDWKLEAKTYSKQLQVEHLIATYNKPSVMLINGIVMGGGAGLALNGSFRIVTENTVFAMPEALIGSFVDVGISYYLSRLPGHYGEYLALTGARINGTEMLASGLATHYILSKNLKALENELSMIGYAHGSVVPNAIEKYTHKAELKPDSAFARLDTVNKCFSKNTVEDILLSLEREVVNRGDEWIVNAIKSMKAASPTSLKICLKEIRKGRNSTQEECLRRNYTTFRHIIQGKLSKDVLEGMRAVVIDKDKRPKWNPSKLEDVSDDFVNKFFQDQDSNEDWDRLELPDHREKTKGKISKL